MMKKLLLVGTCLLTTVCSIAQIAFTNKNSLLVSTNFHSGCPVTVTDWNGDGLDDIIRLDDAHDCWVEVQKTNNQFTSIHLGDFGGSAGWAWAMVVADFDHNGYKDIIAGGGSGSAAKKLMVNSTGTGGTISNFTNSNFFKQNLTVGDFNNDGWSDVYMCDDNAASKVYMNDGTGNLLILPTSFTALTINTGSQSLTVQTGLTSMTLGSTVFVGNNGMNYMTGTITSYNSGTGALVVNVTSVVGSGSFNSWTIHPQIIFNHSLNPTVTYSGDPADSGNYGSAWIDIDNDGDLDLYIAHCRQSSSSPTDLRRINRLYVNDGNGKYTENAAAASLAIGWQTWTPSFGDIDNDGDLDLLATNHDHESQILQNNLGVFADITTASGFDITDITPIESVMEDFDNDGFIDVFAAGSDARMHRNNGNSTFSIVNGLFDSNNMESFAIGDLNHDGFIDIYAGYAQIYTTPSSINDVVWMNNTNSNKFITFDLQGTVSNRDAIGARVTIYGTWGKQIREVRSGESYGTSNTTMCHFGLGTATIVDSAVIVWPSHITQTIYNLAPNQFVKVIENDCVSPPALISSTGNLCFVGDTSTLSANGGFNYLWSDGISTTQSLVVSAAGEYNVKVSAVGNNCQSISPTITIKLNPDVPPVISATGNTDFCFGDSVKISAPAGSPSYTWSNGATTSEIYATNSGNYTVTVPGLCASVTSNAINVIVHTPPVPATMNVTLTAPGTTTLTTSTTNVSWYDVPTGGTAIGTGTTFLTPSITSTSVFYLEPFDVVFSGPPATGGRTYVIAGYSSDLSLNVSMTFDVVENSTLKSVKVYTDNFGIRRFELRDNANALINSLDVNVNTDTMVVVLNFPMTVGTGYKLTTNSSVNNSSLGYTGPRFRRENSGATVNYPYVIGPYANLVGSSQGGSYYPYFYDWHVEGQASLCVGARVADTVFVNTTGVNELERTVMNVFPNPGSGMFTLSLDAKVSGPAGIVVTDVTGRTVATQQIMMTTGKSNYDMNLSQFENGIYFVKLQVAESSETLKVSIQK